MEQFIFKAAARFVIPAFVAAILLRVFQILAWPWWLSYPAAGLLFWHYFVDGAEGATKFLDENGGKALRFDPCVQFLARHLLWSSLPVIVAAVAYVVFPVLLPQGGLAQPRTLWGEGLHDGNLDLRDLWRQFVRGLPPEGLLALRCTFALVFGLIVVGLLSQVEKVDEQVAEDHHHRGQKLITLKEAAKKAVKLRNANDPGIFFGGVLLPSPWDVLHFLFIGAPGSGKTLCMKLLAQSVLLDVGRGRGVRGLWFDAKQDSLSELAGMGVPFKTLNMFDQRGVAWDMAKDITSDTQAEAMAEILMPKNERASQPYFDDAARSLLKGVLCCFIERNPGRWTFRDVIFTLRSRSRLIQVLKLTLEGRELLELYFSKDNTALDVMSTVANKTEPYKAIAAAWARAKERINLADWVEDEYVLVLGNSHVARPAIRAMNQVIFKRLSQLLLEQPNNTHKRTWIFIDELRQAGKLDGIESFAVEGRSRGCCLVLGSQDQEGLEAVYGEKIAGEILGVCAIKGFLRIASANTARWASENVGEQEKFEYGTNITIPRDGSLGEESQTTTEQLVKREVVLPSEIMRLPPTDRMHGLTGYYVAPGVGVWKATLSPKYLTENLCT